jgi:hypothetical protein
MSFVFLEALVDPRGLPRPLFAGGARILPGLVVRFDCTTRHGCSPAGDWLFDGGSVADLPGILAVKVNLGLVSSVKLIVGLVAGEGLLAGEKLAMLESFLTWNLCGRNLYAIVAASTCRS